MATIGSSTEPSVPESGAESLIASGAAAASRPADEAQAIRLVGHLANLAAMHRHQVEHPGCLIADRAGPARAQDGAPVAQDLGLHEQIAEGRMQRVRRRRRDHHFGVTGDLDLAALARAIGDAHPAQLDIVFRRYDDLGIGLELAIAVGHRVAAAKLGAPLGEDRFIALGALQCRLMGCGPGFATRAAAQLAEITEAAPVVAGAILAPARHGEILPAAVAAARVGHHHMVAAVRQQLDFR